MMEIDKAVSLIHATDREQSVEQLKTILIYRRAGCFNGVLSG